VKQPAGMTAAQAAKNVKQSAEVTAAKRDEVRKVVEAALGREGSTRGWKRAEKRKSRSRERGQMDPS